MRLRVQVEDPVLDALPGGAVRRDPRVIPLVMMRAVDTAAALTARPAPAGLTGALTLRVEDDTVPAGTARAAGAWTVGIADGTVTAEELPAPEAADPALPAVHLDVHAASLLLAGGRSLADAERLDLGVRADPAARTLLDALLAGPRPSVMDQF